MVRPPATNGVYFDVVAARLRFHIHRRPAPGSPQRQGTTEKSPEPKNRHVLPGTRRLLQAAAQAGGRVQLTYHAAQLKRSRRTIRQSNLPFIARRQMADGSLAVNGLSGQERLLLLLVHLQNR